MEKDLKKELFEWIKDILVAAITISIIMGALYAYTGNWPPMVVVESESMQHSDDVSYIGVIDTGDIVLSKHVSSEKDITTYVSGRYRGYMAYGDYGDVIIYRPYNIDTTPIIHRAVIYLVWNSTGNGYDAPELKNLKYGEDYTVENGEVWRNIHGTITIFDYGYKKRDLTIPIYRIINYFENSGKKPHSGYITAGDHNIANNYMVDQVSICREPVELKWIVGKAEGELPWFGIIKLIFSGTLYTHPAPMNSWIMLVVSISLIIIIPMAIENIWYRMKYKDEKSANDDEKNRILLGADKGNSDEAEDDFGEEHAGEK